MSLSPQLIVELEQMPTELERVVRSIPTERLAWLPRSSGGAPGEVFSAIGHVCHLRDIEADGYHVRIQRLVDEDDPSLVSLDGYEIAAQRKYDQDKLDSALAAFRDARRRTIEILNGLTSAQLDRAGDFAEYGHLTLRGLLHYLRSHDQQHLAGLHWLIGKLVSEGQGAPEEA